MAGLLDGFTMPELDSPQGQGLLAAAFNLMGAKGNSIGNAIGSAGRDYMATYGTARNTQEALALSKLQREKAQADIEALKRAEQQRQKIAAGIGQFFKPGQEAVPAFNPMPDSPFVATPGRPAVAPSIDVNGMAAFLANNGDYKGALEVAKDFKPPVTKLKDVKEMKDPTSGNLVNVAIYEDGQTKTLPYGVKPDVQILSLGDRQEVVDKNNVQPGATFRMGQSPDSKANNAVAWANYNLSKDRLNFDKAGGADANKPQLVDGAWVYRPDAQNPAGRVVPVSGLPEKPLNDSQSKANLFGSRALEAEKVLQAVAGKADRPGWWKRTAESTVGLVPFAGEKLADVAGSALNWTQSDAQQQVEQAQRDFINATLRRESGASIAPAEFENARKQYFPQIGDSAAVLAQKARNRQTAIEGILSEVPASRRPTSVMSIPPEAINELKMNKGKPGVAEQFDQVFGPGSAKRILGGG